MNDLYWKMTPSEKHEFFGRMTDQEASLFFEQYIQAKDGRLRELRDRFEGTGGGAAVVLDFSPSSLVPLWTWAAKYLHRRDFTPEEIARIINLPDCIRDDQLKTPPLAENSLFLINDLAYYFAEVFIRNHPGVGWDVCRTKRRLHSDKNQPILKGFCVTMNPRDLVKVAAYKKVDGTVGNDDLLQVYEIWTKNIQGPKSLMNKKKKGNEGKSETSEGSAISRVKLITVPGKDALDELNRLRAHIPNTGLYPILLGDAQDKECVLRGIVNESKASGILKKSKKINTVQWFRARSKLYGRDSYRDQEGEWPASPLQEIKIITHLGPFHNNPKKEVTIGLLDVGAPWEAFALFNWGGWNDSPLPAEHCAVHRYWAAKYGAELVSLTRDVVQCVVARPPTNRDDSMQLAREQYLYCYDNVAQWLGSIAALGRSLLNARYWYFWWD